MIFQSTNMALLLASALSSLVLVWAALFSVSVIRHWDMASGHARQIRMERQTYLVSTALVLVMLVELISLMLFVHNADRMAVMFTGAMCAVGTLNVNIFGFPALLFKLAGFLGALVWLIINRVDARAPDYPLTRFKYGFLIVLAPVMLIGAGSQFLYFLNLETKVITSCCSQLFTPAASGLEAQLSALDPKLALWLLFAGLGLLTLLATLALVRPAWALLYAGLSPIYLIMALAAVISVVAPYIYAQPHHHCPFCILKPEYDYIGYGLYLPLFTGTALALAAGMLSLPISAMRAPSLVGVRQAFLHRAIFWSILAFDLFGALCLFAIWSSNLLLFH